MSLPTNIPINLVKTSFSAELQRRVNEVAVIKIKIIKVMDTPALMNTTSVQAFDVLKEDHKIVLSTLKCYARSASLSQEVLADFEDVLKEVELPEDQGAVGGATAWSFESENKSEGFGVKTSNLERLVPVQPNEATQYLQQRFKTFKGILQEVDTLLTLLDKLGKYDETELRNTLDSLLQLKGDIKKSGLTREEQEQLFTDINLRLKSVNALIAKSRAAGVEEGASGTSMYHPPRTSKISSPQESYPARVPPPPPPRLDIKTPAALFTGTSAGEMGARQRIGAPVTSPVSIPLPVISHAATPATLPSPVNRPVDVSVRPKTAVSRSEPRPKTPAQVSGSETPAAGKVPTYFPTQGRIARPATPGRVRGQGIQVKPPLGAPPPPPVRHTVATPVVRPVGAVHNSGSSLLRNGVRVNIASITEAISKPTGGWLVNAADSTMTLRGGISGVIWGAMGEKGEEGEKTPILDALKKEYPSNIPDAGFALSQPGNLSKKGFSKVIHCVGPDNRKINDIDIALGLLENTYVNVFEKALLDNCPSLAIPFISSGIYRIPLSDAVDCALGVATRDKYKGLQIDFYYVSKDATEKAEVTQCASQFQ